MKLTNSALKDLNGGDLRVGPADTDPVLYVADVLGTVALGIAAPGQTYTPEETSRRLKFAMSLAQVKPGDEFEVPTDLAASLNTDTPRFYGVIVAGQMYEPLK